MRICWKDLGADYYYYKCTRAVKIDGNKESIISNIYYIASNFRLFHVQFCNLK